MSFKSFRDYLQVNGLSADLSMLIILPKQRFGLQNVVQSLTADKLRQFRSSLQHHIVQVMMPKFRIEKKFELAEPLAAMGVRDAFDQSKADFTAMVGNGDKASRRGNPIKKDFPKLSIGLLI